MEIVLNKILSEIQHQEDKLSYQMMQTAGIAQRPGQKMVCLFENGYWSGQDASNFKQVKQNPSEISEGFVYEV